MISVCSVGIWDIFVTNNDRADVEINLSLIFKEYGDGWVWVIAYGFV